MPRKPPFKTQAERYLTSLRRRNLAEGTINQYTYVLRKGYSILKDANLRTNPKRISEKEVSHLLKTWRPTPIRMFNTFLIWNDNHIMKDMNIRIPKTEPRRTWLTEEEAQLLVASCQTELERLIVHLELELGFRRIEVQRAKIDHFKGNQILVHGKGQAGGKFGVIPKHPLTDEILADYLTFRKEQTLYQNSDYLIVHHYRGELRRYRGHSLDVILSRPVQRAGLTATNHTLRRTFGRLIYEETKDLETVRQLLRHESIEMTKIYIGTTFEKMESALVILHQKLKKRTPFNFSQ